MKRWMFVFLMLTPPAAMAEEKRPLTVQEALRLAETQAPASRAIDLQVGRAREQVRASGLWPNPELFFSREESAGAVERFANLSQTLPLWGRPGLERSAAESGLSAALASADQERIAFRAGIREAFVDLLLAQERSRLLESGRDRLADLVRILQAREEQGESSGFDRMRAERALADVDADRLESIGMLGAARAILGALVGLPAERIEASGSLAAAGPLPTPEEVHGMAAERGDLRALDAEAGQADRLARAAKRRLVPEPTLTAGTKTSEGGVPDATGPVVALAFSLPLFDRAQSARVVRAEAEVLRARREALALQVGAEIQAAHARATALREAETAYLGAADPESLARIALAAYEAGEMRIFELLDACRTALDARLRSIALQAEARRAEVALGRALGREVTP